MNDSCLFVCNKKTGEKFISGNGEIIWNTGGTATIWKIFQPFNYQRIITGSANDDLMIIPVGLTTDMPIFTIGDKLIIEKGKRFRPVTTQYSSADFEPMQYNATVAVEGFWYNVDEEWSYIVMLVNPGMNPELWEVKEKDVKRY